MNLANSTTKHESSVRKRGAGTHAWRLQRESCSWQDGAFTLVELLVVIAIIGIMLFLLLPAIQAARESARMNSCRQSLRQICLAAIQYEGANGHFPSAGSNRVSWSQHARLLPYLEQQPLWEQIRERLEARDQGDLEVSVTVPVFLCASDPEQDTFDQPARNNYRANAGTDIGRWDLARMEETNDGVFVAGNKIRIEQITDGLSQTALFSESALGDGSTSAINRFGDWYYISGGRTADQFFVSCSQVVPGSFNRRQQPFSLAGRNWAIGTLNNSRYNHLMPPNSHSCLTGRGRGGGVDGPATDQNVSQQGAAATATSWHTGGVHVAFGDGHVELVSEEVSVMVWRDYGSRDGGVTEVDLPQR